MAKHLMEEFKKIKTLEDHVADAITNFCGKMNFVYIHITWFGIWILINIGLGFFIDKFDPFPFGLLTLIVSLEAIFLSTFVMISQNRSSKQADVRAQLDYETDVKAEQEIEQIMTMLQEIHQALGLSKFEALGQKVEGSGNYPDNHIKVFEEIMKDRRALEEKMGQAAAKPLGSFSED